MWLKFSNPQNANILDSFQITESRLVCWIYVPKEKAHRYRKHKNAFKEIQTEGTPMDLCLHLFTHCLIRQRIWGSNGYFIH